MIGNHETFLNFSYEECAKKSLKIILLSFRNFNFGLKFTTFKIYHVKNLFKKKKLFEVLNFLRKLIKREKLE